MSLLFPAGMWNEKKVEARMQDCKRKAGGMMLGIFIAGHRKY